MGRGFPFWVSFVTVFNLKQSAFGLSTKHHRFIARLKPE